MACVIMSGNPEPGDPWLCASAKKGSLVNPKIGLLGKKGKIIAWINNLMKYWLFFHIDYLRYIFSSNHIVPQSSCVLCFWVQDPLINSFFQKVPIKGSGTQKQRPHKLWGTMWFDEKVYLRYLPNYLR